MTSQPGLWRNRGFLILWAGQTISELGSEISFVAIPLTAVVTLNATPFEAGLLGTFQFLPFLLVGLPAGVWVDRMRRRPILIAADVGRAAALGSIPVAAALHALTLTQLYVAGFVVGVLTVFFDVSYQSFLPALVSREQLVEGNAKLELSRAGSQIAGPGLGGVLVGAVTAPVAIVADAVSYIVSVVTLLFVRGAREEVPPRAERKRLATELWEGLRYVVGHPVLRSIAGCTATWNLFGNMAMAVLVLYAVRLLHLSAGLIGLWFALGALGAPAGALLVSRIAGRFGSGPTITGIVWGTAWGYVLVALAPPSAPLPFLVASGIVGSFGSVVYNVTQVSLRQAITPHRLQGRMNASMRFLVWGTIPVGAFLGGLLGQTIGLLPTIWIAAVGTMLSAFWVTFGPVPHVRSAEDVAGGPAPLAELVAGVGEPAGPVSGVSEDQ